MKYSIKVTDLKCPFCQININYHTAKRCLDAWFAKDVLKYKDVGKHNLISGFTGLVVNKIWSFKNTRARKTKAGKSIYSEIQSYGTNIELMLKTWKRLKFSYQYALQIADITGFKKSKSTTWVVYSITEPGCSVTHVRLETAMAKIAILHVNTMNN